MQRHVAWQGVKPLQKKKRPSAAHVRGVNHFLRNFLWDADVPCHDWMLG